MNSHRSVTFRSRIAKGNAIVVLALVVSLQLGLMSVAFEYGVYVYSIISVRSAVRRTAASGADAAYSSLLTIKYTLPAVSGRRTPVVVQYLKRS